MDANQKLKDVNEVIAYLAEKFPKCFSVKGDAKPLKIGIFKDIAEKTDEDTQVSRTQLRQALRRYTASWRYLESVKVGVARIDIDGAEGELIEQEHADHAVTQLTESKARFEERKKEAAAKRKEKKSYKNKSDKGGADAPKRAKFKSKKASDGKPAPKKAAKPPVELVSLEQSKIKAGTKVKIKLGQSPLDGTITEVSKDEIHVQLTTGMVIKTNAASIFAA